MPKDNLDVPDEEKSDDDPPPPAPFPAPNPAPAPAPAPKVMHPLDRKIKTLRSRIQLAGTEVNQINDEGRLAIVNASHVTSFMGMYKALDRYFTKFEQLWEDLLDTYDERGASPSKSDHDFYLRIKRYYYEAHTNIDRVKKPSDQSVALAAPNVTLNPDPRASKNLPKLNLPKFDGNLVYWPKFRDTYISLVHNDQVMSDMEKFHYLVASVIGPAASTISHFSLEERNYALAWEAMIKTYDDKRTLASAYLNQILNHKPIQGKATVESLREFNSKISDSVAAFKLLEIEDKADFILFHLSIKVLDSATRDLFEMAHTGNEFPTFEQLTKFVRERCTALQHCDNTNLVFEKGGNPPKDNKRGKRTFSSPRTTLLANNERAEHNSNKLESKSKCHVCGKIHTVFNCDVFYHSTAPERLALLKNWKGCNLCLLDSHHISECKKDWRCKFCRGKHNSMLHVSKPSSGPRDSKPDYDNQPASTSLVGNVETYHEVLLGTVLGEILDAQNNYQPVRMILDSASQNSFISQRCLSKLGLKTTEFKRRIAGIGATIFDGARSKTVCTLKPRNRNKPTFSTEAVVVKNITSFLPSVTLPSQIRRCFATFKLADPSFWESGPVDFLIGADLFAEVLTGSPTSVGENMPKILPSIFGDVIIGKFGCPYSNAELSTSLCSVSDVSETLQKFWKIEEVSIPTNCMDPDDIICEDHFLRTHERTSSGRYVVHLPLKPSVPENFLSSHAAQRRFYSIENRLMKNPELKQKYVEFMDEYQNLNHMGLAEKPSKYIIPHHSVFKDSKIRVVFDASSATRYGSLNQHLYTGEKLIKDIRDILMNFRIPKYVFTTDAVKMYRQILVHDSDVPYQHIYWRKNPSDPLEVFALKTVTYGTACAPWLALRVIKQLVEDEGTAYPLGAKALSQDIYVDDLATGGSSVSEILQIQQETIDLLAKGGFDLSKWSSNCPQVLERVQGGRENTNPHLVSFDSTDNFVKILGLQWDPSKDCFCYRVVAQTPTFTKRSILSTVAKLYDPLGFLAPTLLLMKGFIQDLWKLRLDWDEIIPSNLAQNWQTVLEDLPTLEEIRIPRFITTNEPYHWQIVGFADASVKGYCGSLYLRIITNKSISVHLVTAKSRLSPVKTETIPRLELNAAVLLADLYRSITEFSTRLCGTRMEPHFFSDSTIVLGWLSTPPHKLKTYVCNRVVKITDLIAINHWHHVSSEENPSDHGSRGLKPNELKNNSLWWNGPPWLCKHETEWPSFSTQIPQDLPEIKVEQITVLISSEFANHFDQWMSRFSSYFRLLRSTARIIAMFRHWKAKRDGASVTHRDIIRSHSISSRDMESALCVCVKHVQLKYLFDGQEHNVDRAEKQFAKLTPFIDEHGILRAGGRLKNANLPDHSKYPIILPNNCHFTVIMVDFYHRIYCHPSPVLLQAMIQRKFWIPSLRKLVRKRTFMCIKCYKDKSQPISPRMGNLPAFRVQGGRAFDHTGTDFAGPFSLKESSRRNAPITKIYLCLFVCMKTKALHLEAVTKLSTEAFLAALSRFIARRGLPSNIYSDCGTNYVGASRHLKDLWCWYKESSTQTTINDHALEIGIKWHFNPPSSPHMGGIWEGGVKSVKRLLRVIAGDTPMNYEEISTLFCKIEAQLNSRPLCPMSTDPEDLDFLSPGHFLIGRPLIALPEDTLLDCKENVLSRWQLVDRMSQQFWTRWKSEYLITLLQRPKWMKTTRNLQVGDLVLVKESESNPTYWPTARVMTIHPGEDQQVRVATIRTSKTTLTRPAVKLIPLLPLDQNPYPPHQSSEI